MTTKPIAHPDIAPRHRPAYNGDSETNGKVSLATMTGFLKGVPLFTGLSETERDALGRDFVRRLYRPGELIFQQDDPGQVLYLVETGQVRIFVEGENGQETSVTFCGPGDVFGELAVIDEDPRSASAVAVKDTALLTLGRDRFREHLRRSPQLALNFMRALSVRVRYNTQQMTSLTQLDVPARLARKLLELAQQYGIVESDGVRIRLTLTQTDLASLTGATRESVNKALGHFKRKGLILTQQGNITVLDPEALRDLAS